MLHSLWYDTNVACFAIIQTDHFFHQNATNKMSKVAPRELRNYSTDCAFIVVLVSSCGRLLADMILCAFDYIPRNESMNSMCFLMIAAYSIAVFFVRKHYFFLL